jgi:ATP/maltotriose-dependent transcriptional regulator MalT
LVDAFATWLTDGYATAAPVLIRGLELVLAAGVGADREAAHWLWLAGGRVSQLAAAELWDDEAWYTLAARQAQATRDAGALVQLQFVLNFLAMPHVLAGELDTAAQLVEEDRMLAEATGNPPVGYTAIALAAWRGREAPAFALIEATVQEATARGQGRLVTFANYARSVLGNGLGRYEAACDAARRAFERDSLGYGPCVVPELAEAAARTGDTALVQAALDWLSERTRARPTDWALGIEARVRALLSDGDAADEHYRESIIRLGRTRIHAELARTHLLYGEWLRRQRRRLDAREQLRIAHQMLESMGIEAFAARARRELRATGETAGKRPVETDITLTTQEAQVARLARDGLSNPEIGARLFISAATVAYHLRKVFTKLGITSRTELDRVLPHDLATARSR